MTPLCRHLCDVHTRNIYVKMNKQECILCVYLDVSFVYNPNSKSISALCKIQIGSYGLQI